MFDVKLLMEEHCESIIAFEKNKLANEGLSDLEIEMKSWDFPWRMESLKHYSSLGWSFVALQDSQVVGYILGQPLLYFNNWTQTLWIEFLSYQTDEVANALMDVSVRWAKTKHLQKVILNNKRNNIDLIQSQFPAFQEGGYLHLSTTKMTEG